MEQIGNDLCLYQKTNMEHTKRIKKQLYNDVKRKFGLKDQQIAVWLGYKNDHSMRTSSKFADIQTLIIELYTLFNDKR